MLLRSSCAVCDTPGHRFCASCWSALVPAPAAPPPVGLDACWSLLVYEGVARQLIVGLKYRNVRTIVGRLGTALAALIDEHATIDVVTWAPTSVERRRERGFDQAQLLARAVARCMERPCRPLLHRLAGEAQTGRSRVERLSGPSFRARPMAGGGVLVVDDVTTTGATLGAAAHALREAGCSTAWGATAARTMRHAPGVIGVTSDQNTVHLVMNAQGDGQIGRKPQLIVGG